MIYVLSLLFYGALCQCRNTIILLEDKAQTEEAVQRGYLCESHIFLIANAIYYVLLYKNSFYLSLLK